MSEDTHDWFYVDAQGKQSGPHDRNELLTRWRSGHLRAESMVWKPGMTAWKQFNDVFSMHMPPPAPPVFSSSSPSSDNQRAALGSAATRVSAQTKANSTGRSYWAVAAFALTCTVFNFFVKNGIRGGLLTLDYPRVLSVELGSAFGYSLLPVLLAAWLTRKSGIKTGLVVGSLIVLLLALPLSGQIDAPRSTLKPSPGTPPQSTSLTESTPSRTSERLMQVLNVSSIGVTKGLLERSLGASTYETPDEARYKVDDCEVTLGMQEGAVTSVSVLLAPNCRFDAAGLNGSTAPLVVAGPITFARFEELFGPAHYSSPCLTACGNAFDPFVDAVVPGPRANGAVDISASSVFVAGPVLEASNRWASELVARLGEDYVVNTRFNCDSRHDDIARKAFANVLVESLVVGRSLGSTNCT